MATLDGIKLIIWDLDETLWLGTLSEEDVEVKKDVKNLLSLTTDAGIVHSICSKNDFEKARKELERLGLWHFFVFPSIDWTPKGERVKAIISDMSLRAVNVLFIDDNSQNLKEVEYYCDGIHTCLPSIIPVLLDEAIALDKNDKEHKRLAQYRVLEEKRAAKSQFSSNDEFLMASNIKVEIHDDCLGEVDRLHELLMRSNQLNYTKFRQPKEELISLLKDKQVKSGYITVTDKYGDYGIVGFFVLKDNKAIHYLFSCRTLGMLVEQWVYMYIGCPEIKVIGEVVTELNDKDLPRWINQNIRDNNFAGRAKVKGKVLFKGPCDMLQMFAFINNSENIDTEFTYTNDKGVVVEGINHSAHIISSVEWSDVDKAKVLNDLPWSDPEMLTTRWRSGNYDAIYYSLVTDAAMGCYRHKETGITISLCEKYYDITKPENWEGLISGSIYSENIIFNRKELQRFSERFEHIIDDEFKLTINNLEKLWKMIPSTTELYLLLGTEIPYKKEVRPAYLMRADEHRLLNGKVKEWARDKDNVFIIEIGKYVNNQSDYVNSINHFTKRVYYQLAEDIVHQMEDVTIAGKSKIFSEEAIATIKRIGKKILKRV